MISRSIFSLSILTAVAITIATFQTMRAVTLKHELDAATDGQIAESEQISIAQFDSLKSDIGYLQDLMRRMMIEIARPKAVERVAVVEWEL